MDKHYDRKYQDMQNRMDKFYDDISTLEDAIAEVENRILSIRQQKISAENVYEFLLMFDKLYDRFTDAEKKEFLKTFLWSRLIYMKKSSRMAGFKAYQVPISCILQWN